MKISEYNDMIKFITRPHKESKGAFQKEVDRQIKDGTYGPGNKNDDNTIMYDPPSNSYKTHKQIGIEMDDKMKKVVKETETNFKADQKNKPLVSSKHVADTLRDYEGYEMKVTYNSATGLFTNPNRDIAFKDANSAHKFNQSIGQGDPPKVKGPMETALNNVQTKPQRIKPFIKKPKTMPTTMPKINMDPIIFPEPYKEDPHLKALGDKVFGEHRRDVEEKNKLSGIETILGIKAK